MANPHRARMATIIGVASISVLLGVIALPAESATKGSSPRAPPPPVIAVRCVACGEIGLAIPPGADIDALTDMVLDNAASDQSHDLNVILEGVKKQEEVLKNTTAEQGRDLGVILQGMRKQIKEHEAEERLLRRLRRQAVSELLKPYLRATSRD
jgi:hypothetical protein